MIPVSDRATVVAFFERLLPADSHPSVVETGLMASLDALAQSDHKQHWDDCLSPCFAALDAECLARNGRPFATLLATEADSLIAALERNDVHSAWPCPPKQFVQIAAQLAAEHFYGLIGSPAWQMIGFDPSPRKRPAGPGLHHDRPALTAFSAVQGRYDVLVIGTGAGGGTVAALAAEAGARVLMIDRGRYELHAEMRRDHIRNHRLPIYGQNTAPIDPGPRSNVDVAGKERLIIASHQGLWHNTAMTVGGGTRVYQGMAWRFHPIDFRLAQTHGVPPGSSLADWPISYEELEPFYTRAEWELGVCGDGTAHRVQGTRSCGYPMPPMSPNPEAAVLRAGAQRLGWSTGPVPLLINSVPRHGRDHCVECGECVGFPCPTDAKNGTHNVMIPRALASGRADLVENCRALRVTTDGAGRVTGAILVDLATGANTTVTARHVVISCGAIESARLLLTSASDAHPHGLGNRTDQVGRHLHGHRYVSAYGLFDDPIHDGAGPGVTIATCDHIDSTTFGGGVLHNECVKLPILFWYWALPPDLQRWGLANKQAMRMMYRRTSHIFGPPQEVPHGESRVMLDHRHRDAQGVPVARVQSAMHPESLRAAERLRDRAAEWMGASGARRVWVKPISVEQSGGSHQAGTCRMGTDPTTSVTDPWGRVHGHDNLWVIDGSLHVTNGGVNPVLNIFALAYRGADRVIAAQ